MVASKETLESVQCDEMRLELVVRRVEAERFATRVHTDSYRIHRLLSGGLLVEADQVASGLMVAANRHLRRNRMDAA